MLSCVSPQTFDDYAHAQMAFRSAEQAGASYHSSSYFNKARSHMSLGELEFKNKNYDKANEYFQRAQKFAERAELMSVLKKSRGGEIY